MKDWLLDKMKHLNRVNNWKLTAEITEDLVKDYPYLSRDQWERIIKYVKDHNQYSPVYKNFREAILHFDWWKGGKSEQDKVLNGEYYRKKRTTAAERIEILEKHFPGVAEKARQRSRQIKGEDK